MEHVILVVDDELDVTDYLKDELEESEQEFIVICKNSGYEAMKVLLEKKIDLLLTDIAMPDMDGHELYNRIKQVRPKLPVIMMTGFGYDPNHVVVKSKKSGLKDVVFKPFNMIKLIALINRRLLETE